MHAITALYRSIFDTLERIAAPVVIPTLARFLFAASLLVYYWNSAVTKVVNRREPEGLFGVFTVEDGAFVQMFPGAMEAAGYSPSALSLPYHIIAYAGTYAEFLLPLLIVVGLLTRLAALGMIGFVVVQTIVDVTGHGAEFGLWFDRLADGLIDERGFWIFTLLILVFRGAGPLSLDGLVKARSADRT